MGNNKQDNIPKTFTEKIIYLGRDFMFKWDNVCPQCFWINWFKDSRSKEHCHRCGFRRDI